VVEEGAIVRMPSHTIKLTPAQQSSLEKFQKALKDNPYSPPSDTIPEPDLLAILVARGEVVKVAEGIVYSRQALDDMVARITARIKENGKVTLGEVRDMFGSSRKYVQALLEYLDGERITKRVGDDRVLY